LGCLGYLLVHYPVAPLFSWLAVFWLALNLIASYSVIRVNVAGTPNNISVGFTVSAALLVLFNPLVATILVALGTLNERDFRRLRPIWLTLYNRSMFVICATAASLLFGLLHGWQDYSESPGRFLAEMSAMTLVYFVCNTFLVRAIVAALDHERFFEHYPFKGDLLLGYLFQCLVAIILVYLTRQSLMLAVLIVGPLWAIRFSLQKIVDLRDINDQLVQSFADALDMRDRDTAGHTRRVATLARLIAAELALSRRELDSIYAAGSLHDLGKIGIPDAILLKCGPLDRAEWTEMKRHPVMGAALLAPYKHLRHVTDIMRHHHEKFDGSGYPDGLAGKEIPIGARVICVADTFMVITDGRPYRRPRSVSEAIAELERCSGSQFDPEVVQAFLRLNPAAMRSILNAGDVPDKQRILQTISPHPLWTRLVRSKGIFCLR